MSTKFVQMLTDEFRRDSVVYLIHQIYPKLDVHTSEENNSDGSYLYCLSVLCTPRQYEMIYAISDTLYQVSLHATIDTASKMTN